jgi:hypothetical protein
VAITVTGGYSVCNRTECTGRPLMGSLGCRGLGTLGTTGSEDRKAMSVACHVSAASGLPAVTYGLRSVSLCHLAAVRLVVWIR